MTAAIGHPTLRLIRVRIGSLELGGLPPGAWRKLTPGERAQLLHSPAVL
jgi:23S rRNA pseudouridine2457 synthase